MNGAHDRTDSLPSLQAFLDRSSALELARRSLIGAPVYSVISLIMLFGTPILHDFGWLVVAEAALLLLLGGVRVWFALGFAARYERSGETAVVQFSVLTAVQSLTLGVLAGVVIWQYWAAQETVLTIVLAAGCVAAGTSALSVRHSAQLIFLACVLVPFGIAVFLVGGLTKAALIIGFLVLMAFLVQDGGQARGIYMQRLRDHYDEQINRRRMEVEDQARRQFLTDVNHELRTPLNSIVGMTDLLAGEELGERARNFVEIIRQSAQELSGLMDDIPGSVKYRHDIQPHELGSLNIGETIEKMLGLYRSQAADKGLVLQLGTCRVPGTVLFGGQEHLEQVLANLLSNAVQFTQTGSITVDAHATAAADGALRVDFRVSDTGVGIAAEVLPSVFDPFSERGAKTSGKYGGGGLGLPICKGLVELMGGEIAIRSQPGQGTVVEFWIAAESNPAETRWHGDLAVEKPSGTQLADARPHRILVVDDDAVHREILCLLLNRLGYEPDQASDGQEAVAVVMQGDYDLIFMDLRMPNLNGLEAAAWIREHQSGTRHPRIVALTGDALKDTRRAALRAGMDDFLPKPIPPAVLEGILQRGHEDSAWKAARASV